MVTLFLHFCTEFGYLAFPSHIPDLVQFVLFFLEVFVPSNVVRSYWITLLASLFVNWQSGISTVIYTPFYSEVLNGQ